MSELPAASVSDTEHSSAVWSWHQENLALCYGLTRGVMELALRLFRGQQQGYVAVLGYATLADYLNELPVADSRTSVYRALRLLDDVVPLVAAPGATFTGDDLIAAGVRKIDMVRALIVAAPPEEAGEWVMKAKELSVSDLRREVLEARGVDMSGAWRDESEWMARQLRQQATRLENAPDKAVALAVLDEAAAASLRVREKLERL